jgi:chorismate mutase
MRLRNLLPTGMIVTAAAAAVLVAPSAGATGAAPGSFIDMTDTSAERALVGDKVAAAKFGTPAPIDDPAREQVVLDNVRTLSVQMGVDPDRAVVIFRDQIEANKVVQRGLYALWTAHPELAPTERPDLVREVRPILDRITTELLEQIKATQRLQSHPSCDGRRTAAEYVVSSHLDLDALHRTALDRATSSFCQ